MSKPSTWLYASSDVAVEESPVNRSQACPIAALMKRCPSKGSGFMHSSRFYTSIVGAKACMPGQHTVKCRDGKSLPTDFDSSFMPFDSERSDIFDTIAVGWLGSSKPKAEQTLYSIVVAKFYDVDQGIIFDRFFSSAPHWRKRLRILLSKDLDT